MQYSAKKKYRVITLYSYYAVILQSNILLRKKQKTVIMGKNVVLLCKIVVILEFSTKCFDALY